MRAQIAACLDSLPCLGGAVLLSILALLAIWVAIRILDRGE